MLNFDDVLEIFKLLSVFFILNARWVANLDSVLSKDSRLRGCTLGWRLFPTLLVSHRHLVIIETIFIRHDRRLPLYPRSSLQPIVHPCILIGIFAAILALRGVLLVFADHITVIGISLAFSFRIFRILVEEVILEILRLHVCITIIRCIPISSFTH